MHRIFARITGWLDRELVGTSSFADCSGDTIGFSRMPQST